jgi:hypothetical protein
MNAMSVVCCDTLEIRQLKLHSAQPSLGTWRKEDRSAHNQSQASAFKITSAAIDDASDWGDEPPRSFG